MAKIDDIVKAIDNKLLETGKEHLILQQASKLLLSLGIIESTKELKQILERGEIPHAYKTNTSPRQWLGPPFLGGGVFFSETMAAPSF